MLERPPTLRVQLAGAVLLLVLAPLCLLAPVLFSDRVYVPWDPARFPPAATGLGADELRGIVEQPAHNDVTELPALVLPEIDLAQQELEQGRFPDWNPYARFGAPLFANSLAALTYPPNWLLLVQADDPREGLGWAAYLSFLIAGLLMFGFLRSQRLRPVPALLGAIAFAFSGTLLVNAHFYMRMNALIWLPGMLWATDRLAQTRGAQRIPSLLGLAACVAMTLLAGFPPFAAASGLLTGLFALVLLARAWRDDGRAVALRAGGPIALGAALGVGLAAIQLLPLVAYFPESNRSQTAVLSAILSQGFDPMGWLGLVLPDAFGHADHSAPAYARSPLAALLYTRPDASGGIQFPSAYNFTEYTIFPGTLPLLLALLGIVTPTTRLRWPALGLALTLGLVATAPAWVGVLYRLPGLSTIPPMRFIGPLCVLIAALAAMGAEAMIGRATRGRVLSVCAIGLVAATVCAFVASGSPLGDVDAVGRQLLERYLPQAPTLTAEQVAVYVGPDDIRAGAERLDRNLWRAAIALGLGSVFLFGWHLAHARRPAWFRVLSAVAVLATLGEMLAFGWPLNSGRVLEHDVGATPVHRFLREQRDRHREQGGITVARAARHARVPTDLPAGTLFAERIRDLNAYAFVDRWSHRAFLRLYGADQMIRSYWPLAFPDDSRLERPFFDLIGLRYVLSADPEPLSHAGRPVGPVLKGPTGAGFRVYERPDPLPRAFVVHALDVVEPAPGQSADDAMLERLLPDLAERPELDPRAAVVVSPSAARTLGAVAAAPDARGATRPVRFSVDVPTEIVLDVAPGEPGYLVLADACLSGWTATAGGAELPTARGNLFMRVLRVPAESLQIRLTYRTPGLRTGTIVTLSSAAAALGLALWLARSRRRRRPAE